MVALHPGNDRRSFYCSLVEVACLVKMLLQPASAHPLQLPFAAINKVHLERWETPEPLASGNFRWLEFLWN